eukprot:PhF_6_TR40422/c0_g1_i3/m.60260
MPMSERFRTQRRDRSRHSEVFPTLGDGVNVPQGFEVKSCSDIYVGGRLGLLKPAKSQPLVWQAWKWNYVVLEMNGCKHFRDEEEISPCCGGRDRFNVSLRMTTAGKNNSMIWVHVNTQDHGNGYYTLASSPIQSGSYNLHIEWVHRLTINNKAFSPNIPPNVTVIQITVVNGENETATPGNVELSSRVCKAEELAEPGVWVQDDDSTLSRYYIPGNDCTLRTSWSPAEVQRCMNTQWSLILGSLSTASVAHRVLRRMYGPTAWIPHTSAFDSFFAPLEGAPQQLDNFNFTRLTHILQKKNGLWGSCDGEYAETMTKKSHGCLEESLLFWGNLAPMMPCTLTPIRNTPTKVLLSVGAADAAWLHADVTELETFAQLLGETIQRWKNVILDAPQNGTVLAVVTAPIVGVNVGFTDMVNRVTCEVAKSYDVPCLDVLPAVIGMGPQDDRIKDITSSFWLSHICEGSLV